MMTAGLPTLPQVETFIGTGQAVSAQKKQNAAAKEQAKFSLTTVLDVDGKEEECPVVLVDNKVRPLSPTTPSPQASPQALVRFTPSLPYPFSFFRPRLSHILFHPPLCCIFCSLCSRFCTFTFFSLILCFSHIPLLSGDWGHIRLANLAPSLSACLSWLTLAHTETLRSVPVGRLAPAPGHKFSGYYFNYPCEEQYRGLVSTISDDPPMLNWIYVDADTRAMRHGGRKDTVDHVIGPWGWTEDEKYLSLRGSGLGFVAVLEDNGKWAIYWDPDGRLRESYEEEDCVEISLKRQMALGIESGYVRG
ncbi:hypothetical protein CSUB01_07045 [Colletotrichum sublineola]|uniref:Uncharacterized protein n=1 Tax=Colletotrichum sublineola TaxID=1173701 RepID=A0A066WWM3_COLSU|nr:hypothetical protein CSUB01_07045 [Colletotrichum sublineola]